MGLKDYTDTKNGPQLAVLKHAVIGDRIGEVKIEKGFLKFKVDRLQLTGQIF